jgi:transposase
LTPAQVADSEVLQRTKEIKDVDRHHPSAVCPCGLTLPSDLTGAEWAVLEPFFPAPYHVGRPRKWPLRQIVEAILYLLRGGLPWRMLPPCFPPVSTLWRWFYLWRDNGLCLSLNHALLLIGWEAVGREASPSAGVNCVFQKFWTPISLNRGQAFR